VFAAVEVITGKTFISASVHVEAASTAGVDAGVEGVASVPGGLDGWNPIDGPDGDAEEPEGDPDGAVDGPDGCDVVPPIGTDGLPREALDVLDPPHA